MAAWTLLCFPNSFCKLWVFNSLQHFINQKFQTSWIHNYTIIVDFSEAVKLAPFHAELLHTASASMYVRDLQSLCSTVAFHWRSSWNQSSSLLSLQRFPGMLGRTELSSYPWSSCLWHLPLWIPSHLSSETSKSKWINRINIPHLKERRSKRSVWVVAKSPSGAGGNFSTHWDRVNIWMLRWGTSRRTSSNLLQTHRLSLLTFLTNVYLLCYLLLFRPDILVLFALFLDLADFASHVSFARNSVEKHRPCWSESWSSSSCSTLSQSFLISNYLTWSTTCEQNVQTSLENCWTSESVSASPASCWLLSNSSLWSRPRESWFVSKAATTINVY